MKQQQKRKAKGRVAKSVLRLPDLEVAKSAVLNSLSCPDAQRGYRHAIDEFVDWYCSEPRLSVQQDRGRSVSDASGVPTPRARYYQPSARGGSPFWRTRQPDCGLLSADLAAGIRRVKGVKKLGVRLGNWLTAEQGIPLAGSGPGTLKGKRDRALLSVLLAVGCGVTRLAELTVDHLQQREGHWAIVDLSGKGGHVRTVPVPDWVLLRTQRLDGAAGIKRGGCSVV